MVAYFGRPSPEMLTTGVGGTADQLASWLITLKGMGLIPHDGRIAADVIGTVPILWRRPHTAMLLDISSKEIKPGVFRLEQLQAAMVIESRGIETAVDRRIRDLLATYTDADHGTITPRQVHGVTCNRLVDDRLPAWAAAEWGQVAEQFVLSFGAGAFERVVDVLQGRKLSLGDNQWFKSAHARAKGSHSGLELYADLARLRRRLEAKIQDRPAAVLKALNLQEAEQIVWTTGHDERAIRSLVVAQARSGEDVFIRLAGRENASPEVAALIPEEASSYFVLRTPLGPLVRTLRQGYMESQSEGQQRAVHGLWERVQRQYGFDSETEVLDQLGDHFIVHTWPPHPLKLPLLWTVWIQVSGDWRATAHAVDGMMTAWQDALNEDDALPSELATGSSSNTRPAPRKPVFRLAPQVKRGADGVWTCQLGLANPSLAVTKGWIVLAWSPEAVRANLQHLQAGTTSTAPE